MNIEGSVAKLGKNVGTDKEKNKITYPVLVGVDKAKVELVKMRKEAQKYLSDLKMANSFLSDLIDFIITRDY